MVKIPINSLKTGIREAISSVGGAVIFYTAIPLPTEWSYSWSRVARWCPIVGLLIGSLLALLEIILRNWLPNLTCNALIVTAWVAITGGLHLDGAMDTADGLSTTDPQRRLEVMQDSATGAFGAIAAVIILLLKTVTLGELSLPLWLVLLSATGWARWGQVAAIAFYPYLRETGKGAFHKENLRLPQDIVLGLIVLLGFSAWWFTVDYLFWWQIVMLVSGNIAIALSTGFWFYRQLDGHTGDTYGAVVEWSEALILCWLTAF